MRPLAIPLAATLMVLAGAGVAVAPAPATAQQAAPPAPFSQAAFDRAQAQGRTILVESHAQWCLPCRAQAPIIADLRQQSPYRGIVVLRVGEDTPRPVWQQFRLNGYGSLVVFKGPQEVARGNPTNRAAIAQLLRQGL